MNENSTDEASQRKVDADISPTLDTSGNRRWLYPDRRSGRHSQRRKYLAMVLIAIYLAVPWISFGGIPLLRLDVLAQKVFLFSKVFAFSNGGYLVFILLMAALALFLVTSVWGRVWCGFACPQTVFVEWVIRPIEELIEGNAHKRRRTDSQPLTWGARGRKVLKHIIFLVVAALASNAFLAYFIPPTTLLAWMIHPPSDHWFAFFFMIFMMAAFYFDLGWFREQFCTFVCPYGRFQSVLMDAETPAVAYNHNRGEPRSKKKGGGDCIDCELCVRVCPTGIDIRKGWQLECIMCYRCIDACNLVMTNLKRPPELITTMSLNTLQGEKARRVRPRTIVYSLLLLGVAGTFFTKIVTRPVIEISLTRAPGTTHIPVNDQEVGNLFNMHVMNLTAKSMPLEFKAITPAVASVSCGSCVTELKPLEERKFPILIRFPKGEAKQNLEIEHVASGEKIQATLIAPSGG